MKILAAIALLFVALAVAQRGAVRQVVVLSMGETAEMERLTKDYKEKEEAFLSADEAQHKYVQVILEGRGLKGEIEIPRSNIGTTTAGCWEDTPKPLKPDDEHNCASYVWQLSKDNKALVLK